MKYPKCILNSMIKQDVMLNIKNPSLCVSVQVFKTPRVRCGLKETYCCLLQTQIFVFRKPNTKIKNDIQ